MDQAISMLAQKGTGKLIRFKPLSAETVTLPKGYVFVCNNNDWLLTTMSQNDVCCRAFACCIRQICDRFD